MHILLLLLMVGLWAGPAQAATYWTENFEYASDVAKDAVWDTSCPGTTATLQLSTLFAKSPTKSLRARLTAGQQGTCINDRSHTATQRQYLGWWYRVDSGWIPDPTAGSKAMISKYTGPGSMEVVWHQHPNSNRMGAITYTGASTPTFCPTSNRLDTACNYYPNMADRNVNDGQWHFIETHAYLGGNVANAGTLEIWVDNVQVMGYYNVTVGVEAGNFSHVNYYAQQGTGFRYIDDLSVGNTRIGYPGAPPSPDTIAPGPVGSLAAPATSSTSSQLTWTVPTDTGGSGIKDTVLLRCTGVSCTPTVNLTNVAAPTATYLDGSLAANTTYGYRAQGLDNAGNLGPLTSTVYVTTPAAGSGAISIDAVNNSIATNTAAALPPFSHTVGVGANRLLNVCTQSRGALANVPVASLTYGATPLTFIRGDTRNDGAGVYLRTEIWRLLAPSSGAANVAVVFGGTLTYGAATSTSYAGVDQTTPVEVSTGASGNSATLAASLTTLTSDAWIQDCAIGRADTPSGFVSVGAGQVARTNRLENATDAVGVSTVNGKTPAGSETMDWTQASASDWVLTAVAIKPSSSGGATPAPCIDTYARTATTLTVGYGTCSPTLPTYIRIFEGNNTNTVSSSLEYARTVPPFDSVTGTTAIMTKPVTPGAQFSGAYARDAAHVENQNSNAYIFVPVTSPIDTAAPILSNLRANGNVTAPQLPNGATSFTFSLNMDKSVSCRYDTTTHATYALFPAANAMTTASLTASVVIASGVPAYPATQTYYGLCQFTDVNAGTHDSTVSSLVVSAAAPAGDTTRPATISGVDATARSQSQASVIWNIGSDNVAVTGYIVYCSFGAASTDYVPCSNDTLLLTTLLNLPANTVVNVAVFAHDAAGNVSLISNVDTITTTALPDLNPPSNPGTLRILGRPFTKSVLLTWPNGSDGEGPVTTLVEQCLQVSAPTECTDFAFKQGQIALSVVSLNLTPSTSYCWRIWHVDQASNKSLAPSNVVCGMTTATGLPQPRTQLPFGVTRLPRTP